MKQKIKISAILMILLMTGIVIGTAIALPGIQTGGGNSNSISPITYYISTNAVYYSGAGSFTDISCNPGDQVISGGGDAGFNNGGNTIGLIRESRPLSSNTWRIASVNLLGQSIQTQSASAICAHTGR